MRYKMISDIFLAKGKDGLVQLETRMKYDGGIESVHEGFLLDQPPGGRSGPLVAEEEHRIFWSRQAPLFEEQSWPVMLGQLLGDLSTRSTGVDTVSRAIVGVPDLWSEGLVETLAACDELPSSSLQEEFLLPLLKSSPPHGSYDFIRAVTHTERACCLGMHGSHCSIFTHNFLRIEGDIRDLKIN
ncbi:hypothetical protein DM860_008040 [Cuscuta australis]|uniref:Uncharacterized protein n=1 Tax=Cuscuta australis TaxID=267555 RepID=A0A328D483_9ASTE|nr:hypothetical protein DM860_008040 [Cuscuta australis]